MEEIAGYRVVRVVRDDGERRVLAGFGDEAVELHVGAGAAAVALAAEADALLPVPHPHLVPVLDVATVGDAVVLVRPRPASTVAAWLLARPTPRAGEVVTVAAPVLDAVGALHAAGRIAGRIDLHAVVLDDDGAPALAGLGACVVTDRPTIAWRESDAGVARDCEGLRALVAELLATTGEQPPQAMRDALDRRDAAAAGEALLAAWPATPIEHGRVESASAPLRQRARARRGDGASTLVRWAQGALAQAGTVRRPVWVAAAAGAAALVVAFALVGAGASSAEQAPVATSATSAAPAVEAAAPTGMPAAETPAVDAATHLLVAREACLDAADDTCLAGILDPSGGAGASTWRLPQDAVLAEVAVLGDAVLVDVASSSEPASVLVVRTDAGWMLRDAWAA